MSSKICRVAFIASMLSVMTVTSALAQYDMSSDEKKEADQVRKTAREFVHLFYSNDLETLHGYFTDELQQTLSLDALRGMRRQVAEKLGNETAMVDEIVEARASYVLYVRRATYEKYTGNMDGRWVLRDGKIAGLEFKPAKP